MLTLMERLAARPRIRSSFMEGQLEWTKAVEITRATEEAPQDEERWLARALTPGVTARDLRRARQEERGEEPLTRVVLELDGAQLGVLREAWRALRSEGLDLERGAATIELVQRALAGGVAGTPTFRVLLSQDLDTDETTLMTRDGPVRLSPNQAGRLLCGAELQSPSGAVKRTMPRRIVNKVHARSKGWCEVPGCRNRAVEIHHLLGWRRGHDPNLLLHVCAAHHRAPHEGLLRIEGSWILGLTFRLADGTLLGVAGGPAVAAPEPEATGCVAPAPEQGPSEDQPEAEVLAAGPSEVRATEAVTSAPLGLTPGAQVATAASAEPAGRRQARAAARSGGRDLSPSETDACSVLVALEMPVREARARIQWLAEHRPELAGDTEQLVRAALVREGRATPAA